MMDCRASFWTLEQKPSTIKVSIQLKQWIPPLSTAFLDVSYRTKHAQGLDMGCPYLPDVNWLRMAPTGLFWGSQGRSREDTAIRSAKSQFGDNELSLNRMIREKNLRSPHLSPQTSFEGARSGPEKSRCYYGSS